MDLIHKPQINETRKLKFVILFVHQNQKSLL